LGADPVEMFLPDLYNALKDGLVDGEDNPLLVLQANHLDEVQKYVSLTGHFYNPLIFMMNADRFKALTAQEQQAIRLAAEAGAEATRQVTQKNEKAVIQAFRKKGLKVIDTIDRAAFEKALAPLQPEFDKRFGADLLRQIRETR
jgi:TRAP-type C4-dicarboxylate transport system substrate-binding protein